MNKKRNHSAIAAIQKAIEPLQEQLYAHQLYAQMQSLNDVQIFTQHHIFAVWDFMSLLKTLQARLTCTQVPWQPSESPSLRRFINEIVLEEESDIDQNGQPISHFELYYQAMQEINADTHKIEQFMGLIVKSKSVKESLAAIDLPESVQAFVNNTFSIIESGDLAQIAGAFTFGREDLIPGMFTALLKDLNQHHQGQLSTLLYYLERHIDLDGGQHGVLAMQLLEEICGDDAQKWAACQTAAVKSLEQRIALWDGVLAEMKQKLLTV